MIINHGIFNLYEPKEKHHPQALYCQNENEVCWYTIAWQKPKPVNRWFVLIKDGVIMGIDTDPERIWPLGYRVIETDELVTFDNGWDGQAFTPPVNS